MSEISRAERIELMQNIKVHLHAVVKSVFDEILKELDQKTITLDGKKVIHAQPAKLSIRATRKEVLDRLATLGENYESTSRN